MRWMMVSAALLIPGCLWGGDARDESSAWIEPGLFDQLTDRPKGYGLEEERTPIAIPVEDAAVVDEWHAPAVIRITQGAFELGTGQRGDGGSYDLIPRHDPYGRGADGSPDRDAFLAFARTVIGLSEAGYQDLGDGYEATFAGTDEEKMQRPYGEGVVIVQAPFTLGHVFEELGPVVPDPGSTNLFWREGGGWNVTYVAPLRVLTDGAYRLEVGPQDVARFSHEGRSNLEDRDLAQRLATFMEDLGRTSPEGIRFFHSHGD